MQASRESRHDRLSLQGNRQGAEKWREERGGPVFSQWTVRGEWKDVVVGREERKMNGA